MPKVETHFKTKPVRLKGTKKRDLNDFVINRDKVCQNLFCESGWPLDIPHHVIFKSASGSDCPSNLTLLCCRCHRLIHHEGKLKVSGIYPDFVFEEL